MSESKVLSMLGLARRAGKLSMGHDMAHQSLIRKTARMIILTCDSSARLEKEFKELANRENADIPIIKIKLTMNDIHYSLGYKSGIMTVDDVNFSKRIEELTEQEDILYGN